MALASGIKNILIVDGWCTEEESKSLLSLKYLQGSKELFNAIGELIPEAPSKPIGSVGIWFPSEYYVYSENADWSGIPRLPYRISFEDQVRGTIWRWITPIFTKANLPVTVTASEEDLKDVALVAYFTPEFADVRKPAFLISRALLRQAEFIRPRYEILNPKVEINRDLPERIDFSPNVQAFGLPLDGDSPSKYVDDEGREYASFVVTDDEAHFGYDYWSSFDIASSESILARIQRVALKLGRIPMRIEGAWNVSPSLYSTEEGYALALINFNDVEVRVKMELSIKERVKRITDITGSEIRFKDGNEGVSLQLTLEGDGAAFLKINVS
ncbi:MAG: hypothetical protein ACUVUS_08650 [Thermoproteota archaeon]